MQEKYYSVFAGLSGFMAMVAGALAAHRAHDPYTAELLRQASYYQLAHSIVLLWLAGRQGSVARIASFLFALGIVLFCGGLCMKALGGPELLTKFIPFGGGCLMFGWLAIILHAIRKEPHQSA